MERCSTDMGELITIALAWLAYGALHSLAASLRVKGWVARHYPTFLPAYRLAYNLIATVLLLPPLALTWRLRGPLLWDVPAPVEWAGALLAVGGFAVSLRWYDGATFLGLRQWRDRVGPDAEAEAFTLSPLHRHVRHPWYTLGLLFLWTRDMDAAWLVTAASLTLYLVVGSRLEENKLIARYGEAYRRYRGQVPAFVPWPGRSLSPRQAKALEALARQSPAGMDHR
jgi:protein-S-isoprenylcysteine O-methyltransferase Ste14